MPKTPSAKATVTKASDTAVATRKVAAKKPPVKSSPTATAATKARKPAEPASSKPSLKFYPAADLHKRLIALLDKIDDAADATLHRAKLLESVTELTTAGFDYYFTRPLKEAKVGFVTQQSANLGLMGVQQVMAPVVRKIIGRLEHAQLQAIAQAIRQLMQ